MRSSDFVNHSYDYRPNWTPLSPVTITNSALYIDRIRVQIVHTSVWHVVGYTAHRYLAGNAILNLVKPPQLPKGLFTMQI